MYDAKDVSMYIIKSFNDKGICISNLKLQKILYFVQGFFLAFTESPCFYNNIEAWPFGPVVPDAYDEFGRFGSNSIPVMKMCRTYTYTRNGNCYKEFKDSMIKKYDKDIIDAVIFTFKDYSSTALVEMTCNHGPWKNVYDRRLRHIIITQKSMKEYFKRKYIIC